MCNTKCNKKLCCDHDLCCHEEDLLCCMPLMHCCGGYSEHNNCCPHDRCCNHPCGGCCDPCGKCDQPMCCCCYKLKKAFDAFKDETKGSVTSLEGRLARLEVKEGDDYTYLLGQITNLAQKEQDDVNRLDGRIDKEIADRIADVDAEETRAKTTENSLNNKIDKEIADRKDEAIADALYINNSGDAYIKFINANGEELRRIDAKPFIKDGLLNDVKLVDDPSNPGDKALCFIFNTDSGKSDIYVPVGDIFEYDDYYTKTQIDAKETALNNAISAETAARLQADTTLLSNINSEKTARQLADTALDGKIAAEKSRAEDAEETLQSNIDAEKTRALGVESALTTNLNNHINDSTRHITAAERTKWNAAEPNVQSDWNEASRSSDAFILNKPTRLGLFTNDTNYITLALVPAQQQVDWNATSGVTSIANKPTIVSAFTNDAGYITLSQVPNANVTIGGTTYTLLLAIDNIVNRLATVEGYWKRVNGTLTPVTATDTVTAPAFYDSSVN